MDLSTWKFLCGLKIWCSHIVVTISLVLLMTQIIFLTSVILALMGFTPPLLVDRGVDVNSRATSCHGNLLFILPLSIGLVLPISYHAIKGDTSVRRSVRVYLHSDLIVIIILLLILVVYLGSCLLAAQHLFVDLAIFRNVQLEYSRCMPK